MRSYYRKSTSASSAANENKIPNVGIERKAIPAISRKVMGVTVIQVHILVTHPEMPPVPTFASLLVQVQSLKDHTVVRTYLAMSWEFL
ncbi:hypothetical protein TNCV_2031701 [Trichonephila clavipes]|nr:hypothetical protein TNCV_2031701 [Trichonephila clavipes]